MSETSAVPKSPMDTTVGVGKRLFYTLLGRHYPVANDGELPFLHTQRVISRGLTIVVVFVVGFFLWAAIAPLQSAIISPGFIVVASHEKVIQHLESGIVKSVLVSDGELVKPGQTLLVLDNTQAQADVDLLQDESDGLEAQEARLLAQRQDADHITFPADLLARQTDSKVAQDMAGEQKTFETKRQSLQEQIDILSKRKGENATEVAGFSAEQKSIDIQLALIQKEQDGVQQMVDKGLEPLPRLLALQRQAADLTGQRGQIVGKMSQVQVNNGENDLQILNLKSQALDDALKDLRDVQSKRFDLLDRMQAARDVLNRTVVTSPAAGKVVNLTIHTKGAVIKPGDTLMDVVPIDDKLEVEAHVRPEDADQVHVGMPAKLSLNAYESRRLPMIMGEVNYISADRQTDERTGQAYFTAHISVDRSALKNYPGARIIPGEPVEAAMQTGTRTALEYFIEPIRDVIRNGMKER